MDEEWTILYHLANPPFAGRAQPIRFMFVDAGIKYNETNENLYGPNGFCDMFRSMDKTYNKEAAKRHTAPFPVVAPPMIWHRPKGNKDDVFISQLPAILRYVGTILGYIPNDNSAALIAQCDNILCNVCDYISEGRSSFHPIDNGASYYTQKEEGDRMSLKWSQSRMLIWLQCFEKTLQKRKDGILYVVGDCVTYADIALYWACDVTEAQFDTEYYQYAWKNNADIPLLKKFKLKFDQRSNIAAWTDKVPYAGDSMM